MEAAIKMKKSWHLNRRTFLRGSGVSLALPMLSAMLYNRKLRSQNNSEKKLRYLAIFVPNGMINDGWNFNESLSPLDDMRSQIIRVNDLRNRSAKLDRPCDHMAHTAAYLSSVSPDPRNGVKNSISIDQVMANNFGNKTALPSIQLGPNNHFISGTSLGYSRAFSQSISWGSNQNQKVPILNPAQAFDRIVANVTPSSGQSLASPAQLEEITRRFELKKSILDYVKEDTQSVRSRLGRSDKGKLEEYLASIRDFELKIQNTYETESAGIEQPVGAVCQPGSRPGSNLRYDQHIKAMADVLTLAFQCDATRVATMMFNRSQGNVNNLEFQYLGLNDTHHHYQHYEQPNWKSALKKIDRHNIELFRYLIGNLNEKKDIDGSSLLDNSFVLYGSGMNQGHGYNQLPILVAGKAGGRLKAGNTFSFRDKPLANLHLTALQLMGSSRNSFANSNGTFSEMLT